MSNLEKVKNLSWPEVFEIWHKTEAPLEHWQKLWKEKGFTSWEAWRQATHANLRGQELSWGLYKIQNSADEIPNWRGGMFHAWAKWFYPVLSEQPPRLKDLVAHPGISNHWYVREISKNFPTETTITTIRFKNGDLMVVEGMHRCCAIAVAAHNQTPLNSNITVAVADWPFDDPPRLGLGWDNK
ncbi:MAG: hypothetical protein AAB667_01275 [Patescibacteria group bacterium]